MSYERDLDERSLEIERLNRLDDDRYWEHKNCAEVFDDTPWPSTPVEVKPVDPKEEERRFQEWREYKKQFDDYVFKRRDTLPKPPQY